MSLKRFTINGYGQIELNQVAFRRDGRIEAQCKLDPTQFTKAAPAENGMLLAVDSVTNTIHLYDATKNYPLALNYTTEHMYDERHNALKDFCLTPADGFYPRLGYLAVGDRFTTNCLSYDDTEYDDDDAVKDALKAAKTTAVYGTQSVDGSWKLTATKPASGVVAVAKASTMPDGSFAAHFTVLAC